MWVCRSRLRECQGMHNAHGSAELRERDARGGASSDDEDTGPLETAPIDADLPQTQFIVDESGVVFQDVLCNSLEEEVNSYKEEIGVGNIRKMEGFFRCTLCPFRSFRRLQQLRDHVRTKHIAKNQFVCSGTKQVKAILALHDADCMKQEHGEDYLFRSAIVMSRTISPPLCRKITAIDKSIRLLFTEDGPVYVNKVATGDIVSARRVLNIYYDKSFAEMMFREIMLHHSNVKSTWPRLHLRALEGGNVLGNLYPSHNRHWWPIVEDIIASHCVQQLRANIFLTLERNQEFVSISIDATLKVCTTVQGQASYRAPLSERNAACFGDQASLRKILTIRGRSGAVLGMIPVMGEDAVTVAKVMSAEFSTTAVRQVKHVASDSPSTKLFRELKQVCSNLSCLSLDPVHLAITYEYAQWGKRTKGSKILRRLLNKWNHIDPAATGASWGPFFTGEAPPMLSREEERFRQQILEESMSSSRAKEEIQRLDAECPLYCRVTFIEVLAAIVKEHSAEVNRKVTGMSKEVRKVLWAAAAPDRMEWLLNGTRFRHELPSHLRAFLPSGTSSNEALHAEVNSWSRSIRMLHQSTLRLKMQILQLGKLLPHHVAQCFPTSRQWTESIVLARALSSVVWTDDAWVEFCSLPLKAAVPLHRLRQTETSLVRPARCAEEACVCHENKFEKECAQRSSEKFAEKRR
eukprot:Skav206392  [mRNA]  locus=scaffold834:641080:643152:- [translate_table: standard]